MHDTNWRNWLYLNKSMVRCICTSLLLSDVHEIMQQIIACSISSLSKIDSLQDTSSLVLWKLIYNYFPRICRKIIFSDEKQVCLIFINFGHGLHQTDNVIPYSVASGWEFGKVDGNLISPADCRKLNQNSGPVFRLIFLPFHFNYLQQFKQKVLKLPAIACNWCEYLWVRN